MKSIYLLLFLFVLASCEDAVVKNRRELSATAEKINEKCPVMIDSETRLEGIGVKEPNTLVYRYTLVNLLASNVDTVQFYRALWPGIITNIRTSIEMKKLRETNTLIEYYYQDKTNTPIYTFHISPADYNSR